MINIYEADYNLLLNLFWSKFSTNHTEATNTIGLNQWRRRSNCSGDNVGLIDEFVTEFHRLTF